MKKTILGLDLGTNSIGWALIKSDFERKQGEIIGIGSRIIPMSQDILGKFDSGQSISQTASRTQFRGIRRLLERDHLRRERLHRVLYILGFLPVHYSSEIDFEHRLGQFVKDKEPKIAYDQSASGKNQFIFQESFEEMLADFKEHQPLLVNGDKKVPYDWTIYYLRKKALTQMITKEELAWLLLHFNQKRGYYQLRGEIDELDNSKSITYHALKVIKVEQGDRGKGSEEMWYNVTLENGWIYRRTSKTFLDWEGKIKEFIVTEDRLEDGTIKRDSEGKEKRSFKSVDSEQDWIAIKKSTEEKLDRSQQTVGSFIYDTLLQKPDQKIRGKLIRTIERKFYKNELRQILEKQKVFHPELKNQSLYQKCLQELYAFNEAHKESVIGKDFTYLFLEDIIFYQRPLKSKKSLISNCSFEQRTYFINGDKKIDPIKCIAKSNPLFQEFRLLQFLANMRIFSKGATEDFDVTAELLPTFEERENLLFWLNDKTEIDQKSLLRYPPFQLEAKILAKLGPEKFAAFIKDKDRGLQDFYRWNYVEEKTYPANETRGEILKRLHKLKIDSQFLTKELEGYLWHILYSVDDKVEIISALSKFAKVNGLSDEFVDTFKRYPQIKKEYGSYSEKAIKKLLSVMRFGKNWDAKKIDHKTISRITNIMTSEYDESIRNRVREKALHLSDIIHFQNLPLWLASYVVYDRHAESADLSHWKNAKDIVLLKQHFLRNPIVEQVINETLQVIRDIWVEFGQGEEDFFSEIHVELGREMKNNSKEREQISKQNQQNENTNLRIKSLLLELMHDSNFESIRPYSPYQQEILKIYEEGVFQNETNESELLEIEKIRRKNQPTSADLRRYKLWLEQGYKSPYTGAIIPLSRLFTPAFQIEHIIPQSRLFDDSLSNKVICEAEVNADKDNMLSHEYIKNNQGKKIQVQQGRFVTLLDLNAYEANVVKYFSKNKTKMKKLLMDEIPDSFIERQLNDTKYISKVVKSLLSNIVRQDGETESTAKNIVVSNGSITSTLRQDWGLNDVWNEIIKPRFQRLNQVQNNTNFGKINQSTNKFLPEVPFELSRGFSKKRIDHRHHAVDALVVACSSRNHINYLNNQSAKDDLKAERFDLRNKLRIIERYSKNGVERTAAKEFLKPWDSFTADAKTALQKVIISFKKNTRVINKTANYYQKWEQQEDGKYKKVAKKQESSKNWAIRKPLHKDTVSGLVNLRLKKVLNLSIAIEDYENIVDGQLRAKITELKKSGQDVKKIVNYFKGLDNTWQGKTISKVEVFYNTNDSEKTKLAASRVKIDESFDLKKIESVTDSGIRNILLRHRNAYIGMVDEKGASIAPEVLAFAPDGIDLMNQNLATLNDGKIHKPIYKVRTFETFGNKFNVGSIGNKVDKYVEAAKGTNLFFAIYQDDKGNRSYESVPLNVVIENQKLGALAKLSPRLSSVPVTNVNGDRLLFFLSPNDLVYVPTPEEIVQDAIINFSIMNQAQQNRIYKFVSCTGSEGHFVPNTVAAEITKNENGTNSKSERTLDFFNGLAILDAKGLPIQIKSCCWKLEVSRLGKILKVIK